MWNAVKQSLRSILPENELELWISPLHCVKKDQKTLILSAPDRFFCSWVQEHYLDFINEAASSVANQPVTVLLKVGKVMEKPVADERSGQFRLPGTKPIVNRVRSLHPAYTFEQFMAGESNALALSACDSLARGENNYGNCLFLTSSTGLGKSHLTQAVAHKVMDTAPSTRLHYLTAQNFTSEMVDSLKKKQMDQFSQKYVHQCDILLIEDIHTLVGRNKSQEELNIVLDYLIKSGKRVIITSALAPRKLGELDEDFRSRMTSGLVAGIKAPDYETRVKIINHKAAVNGVQLGKETVDYLARNLHGDVRRTESALLGIKARLAATNMGSELDAVKDVLKELVGEQFKLDGRSIQNVITSMYNVSLEELVSRSRKRSVVFPRQIAMYLTRKYTDASLSEIGSFYNRDHSTVLYAIKAVDKAKSRRADVQKQIELVIRKLKQS